MMTSTDCLELLIELRMILSGKIQEIHLSPRIYSKISKEHHTIINGVDNYSLNFGLIVAYATNYGTVPVTRARRTYVY